MKTDVNRSFLSSKSTLLAGMLIVFSLVTILSVHPAFAEESSTARGEQVAIRVDDETITMQEFNRAVDQQVSMMQKRLSRGKTKAKPKSEMIRKRVKQQVKQGMIDQLVVKSHAKKSDVSVPDSLVQEQWNRVVEKAGGEQVVQQKLKQSGMSKKQFLDQIREKELLKRFVDKNTPNVEVTDEEVREIYEKNKKRMKKMPYEKAKKLLKRRLEQQKKQQNRRQLVQELKKKSKIEVNV